MWFQADELIGGTRTNIYERSFRGEGNSLQVILSTVKERYGI